MYCAVYWRYTVAGRNVLCSVLKIYCSRQECIVQCTGDIRKKAGSNVLCRGTLFSIISNKLFSQKSPAFLVPVVNGGDIYYLDY